MATMFGSAPSSSKISYPGIVIDNKIGSCHQINSRGGGVKIPKSGKGRLRCEMEKKGMREAIIGVVSGSMNIMRGGAAVGLVEERMNTEGRGLPFGLSDNILGWILLGVFGLIWAFYIDYASRLEEDEDSGLSL